MSERKQTILAVILVILLPIVAFAGGYFTNDYVDQLQGRPTNDFTAAITGQGDRLSDEELILLQEAWRHIEDNFIGEEPDTTELNYALIRGALSSLEDRYTIFLEPVVREEEQNTLRGNFGGIGVYLTREEASGEVVLQLIPGNPAEEAGILDGDVLLAVDDVAITADTTMDEIGQLVRGEVGTDVILLVRHPNTTEPVAVAVTRGNILIPSVEHRILATPDEAPTVGYVKLVRFSGESEGEVSTAVEALLAAGAERLILDLRGNGGGLLDAAIDIANLFVRDGDLMRRESKDEGERIYQASNIGTVDSETPLIVLTDGGTASASEILAGALRDRERALLFGSKTFGKGSVQLIFDLSDGSSVHVTSSRWYTPNGTQIDELGLEPDVAIEPTAEDIDNGRDAVLNAAVTYFLDEN